MSTYQPSDLVFRLIKQQPLTHEEGDRNLSVLLTNLSGSAISISGSIVGPNNILYSGSYDSSTDTIILYSGETSHSLDLSALNSTDVLNGLLAYSSSLKDAIDVTTGHLVVKNNLYVLGTTTTIDSTTLSVADNIIQLNGTAANFAGLVVNDEIGTTTSGSLLWDTTNDYWIAGPEGSETRVLLLADRTVLEGRLDSIEVFTGSADTRLTNLESRTGSLDGRLDALEIYTGSNDARLDGIEEFTSSADLRLTDLESRTGSLDGRIDALEIYTGSNDTRLDGIEIFTSSADLRLTDLESRTGSLDGRIDALELYTGSADIRFDALEIFSGSAESRLDHIEAATSSYLVGANLEALNIFTGSAESRLDHIEAATSSYLVDADLDSIHAYTASLKTAIEVDSTNVTIKGNLTVEGTQTAIDSTTINLGDNIISLNGGGGVNGGLLINDVTNPLTVSGSLLWDSTNDYWIAGPEGSEARLLTAADSVDLTPLNDYTGSNDTRLDGIEEFTSSADIRLTTLESLTGSLDARLDSLELYTGSNDARLDGIEVFTGSAESRLDHIEAATSSYLTNSNLEALNDFTGSASSRLDSLEVFTGSADIRLDNLEAATSSYVTNDETGSFYYSSSVDLNIITFYQGDGNTELITIDTGSAADLTGLNEFSASAKLRLDSLEAATSSYVTNDETGSFVYSGSYDNSSNVLTLYSIDADHLIDLSDLQDAGVDIAALNLFTGSAEARLDHIEAATSSYVTNDETGSFVYSGSYDGTSNILTLYSINEDHNIDLSDLQDAGADLEPLNTFSGSAIARLDHIEAATSSYVTNDETGSFYYSSSVDLNTITFYQGDGTTESVTVDTGSVVLPDPVDTGSLMVTGSVSSNELTFTKGDGTTFTLTVDTGSDANDIDYVSNIAYDTGSIAFTGEGNAYTGVINISPITASSLVTSSANLNEITFTKGDGSTFSITVDTGSDSNDIDYVSNVAYSNGNISFTGTGNAFSNSIGISAITGSSLIGSSVNSNTLTFTRGNGTTFDLTVATGSAGSVDYLDNVALVDTNLVFGGIGSAFSASVDLSSIRPTPGGVNGSVQYNSNGSFAGENTLLYNDTGNILTVSGSTATPSIRLANQIGVPFAGTLLGGLSAYSTLANADIGTIKFVADGTFSNNDMPTRLEFAVSQDNSETPVTRMVIKADGRIGVGVTNPGSGKFEVNGSVSGTSIYASHNIVAYSDARSKTNVTTIDNALDKVDAIRGVTYNKVEDPDGIRYMGVIAQELQEVLPEVVAEGEDGSLAVAYGNIVGVLIEAVKELRAEIRELKEGK